MIANTVIHVGTTFDRKFLTPFYVLAASIFENNKDVCVHIHVVTPDLTDDDKTEMVKYITGHNGKVSFHEPDPSQVSRLPPSNWYPPVGFFRLFLAEMLQPSGIDKVIYLDTDIVVVGSLLELYNQDTGSYPFAVVIERNATKTRPDLGLLKEYTYFNSGMTLINIPAWIRQDVTGRTLDYLSTHPNLKLGDQDALNVLFEGNYMPLDQKFNVVPQDIPENLAASQYASYIKDKVIIHYAAHWKPWMLNGTHKLRHLYFHYLKLSPRAGEPHYHISRITPGLVYEFLKIRTKEKLYEFPWLLRVIDSLYRSSLARQT